MIKQRTVFFVSDRTGITAELLGRSLLTQFQGMEFHKVTLPFVDTIEKAQEASAQINLSAHKFDIKPLVFSTLIDADTRAVITSSEALVLDLFAMFIRPLEIELDIDSSHELGLSHGINDHTAYNDRIDAVNFSLNNDDGISVTNFTKADVILIGVSRSGKTPTCLYLAMQYGIRAANYPLTPDDFQVMQLPKLLQPFRRKLYALTIAPERLSQIRNERTPNSHYADIKNCEYEIKSAESIFKSEAIPYLDTTTKSIEEIASMIVHATELIKKPKMP